MESIRILLDRERIFLFAQVPRESNGVVDTLASWGSQGHATSLVLMVVPPNLLKMVYCDSRGLC